MPLSVLYIDDPLAQLAEHLTFNQRVRSSNLRWLTNKSAIPVITGVDGLFVLLAKEGSL